jgi:hypothetical protein
MTADALMSRHTAAWQAATVHPFLEGVRDGSLPEHSFDRWLAQDYLFAQALVRAQSRIAATAPSPTSASSRAAWSRRACPRSAEDYPEPRSSNSEDPGPLVTVPCDHTTHCITTVRVAAGQSCI